MRVIRGRKAFITGAASGIGKAIALALASEGADLFLVDLNREGLLDTARTAEQKQVAVQIAACDLTREAEVTDAVARALAWGEIQILVNCAGVAPYGALHLMSAEDWRRAMAVNLLAPMQIVREFLPALSRAEEAHILNVCSIAGLVPWRKVPVYQAGKYGLVGFTLSLRADYSRPNFGISALCPGFVRTPLLSEVKDPERHRSVTRIPAFCETTPDVVAAAAVAALYRNRGVVVVTAFARAVWWLSRFSPALFDWIVREGWRRRGKLVIGPF